MHVVEKWRELSLCYTLRQTDPEMWDRFYADSASERRPARNFCFHCPVREQCLREALERKEIWGVWGGCDESELRRALWVNANGRWQNRCRYPHCPYCKGRPSCLFVTSLCDVETRKRREQVECMACGFFWRSATSVAAVKAYWRDKANQNRISAKATKARIPSRQPLTVLPGLPPIPPAKAATTALAASAAIRPTGT